MNDYEEYETYDELGDEDYEMEFDAPDEWMIWDELDRNSGSGYDMPRPE